MSQPKVLGKGVWPAWPGSAALAAALVMLGVVWDVLGPAGAGGSVYYVITRGTSMLPRFHTGDLAIVRQGGPYHIGQIVLYRYPKLGLILHRIIGYRSGYFIMKGDHNAFADPYHPRPSDIVGHLWLHVHGIGMLLSWLHDPAAVTGLVVAIGSGVLVMPRLAGEHARPGGAGTIGARSTPGRPCPRFNPHGSLTLGLLGPWGMAVGVVIAVIGFAGAATVAAAFGSATTRPLVIPVRYTEQGRFSYHAVGPTTIYANGQVTTGQPVYDGLVHNVTFSFAYRIASPSAVDVTGTDSLVAVVSEPDGWSRTVPLSPASRFRGSRVTASGVLNLDTVKALLAPLGNAIAATGAPGATVTISPRVAIRGHIAGQRLSTSFAPGLPFTMDATELSLAQGPGGAATADLSPIHTGAVGVPTTTPASFDLLGAHLRVRTARVLGLAGLAVGILGAIAVAVAFRRTAFAPEAEQIQARYRRLLVEARPSAMRSITAPVDLAGMDELARIADQQGCPVLHWREPGGMHRYVVATREISYAYSCPGCDTTSPPDRAASQVRTC